MKHKVKINGISYMGQHKSVIFEMDFPDFEVIPSKVILGYEFPETTIQSQMIDYLDEYDMTNKMEEYGFYMLMDRKLHTPKSSPKDSGDLTIPGSSKEKDLFILINFYTNNEEFKNDLYAAYVLIHPKIKSFSVKTQLDMLLSHVNLGYKAVLNNLNEQKKAMESPKNKKIETSKPLTNQDVLKTYKYIPDNTN